MAPDAVNVAVCPLHNESEVEDAVMFGFKQISLTAKLSIPKSLFPLSALPLNFITHDGVLTAL